MGALLNFTQQQESIDLYQDIILMLVDRLSFLRSQAGALHGTALTTGASAATAIQGPYASPLHTLGADFPSGTAACLAAAVPAALNVANPYATGGLPLPSGSQWGAAGAGSGGGVLVPAAPAQAPAPEPRPDAAGTPPNHNR